MKNMNFAKRSQLDVKDAVNGSYVQSLLWVTLFAAVISAVSIVIELVYVDFIHGNSHRTQANALQMMSLFPPIMGVVALIWVLLVFTFPQCFQAMVTRILLPRIGRRARFIPLLVLPITALITWFCFDYLTLHFDSGDPDYTPYEHGVTLQRYLITLAVQAPVTLFGVLHCDAATRGRSKKPLIIAALLLAVVVGGIWGHRMAEAQYQFL